MYVGRAIWAGIGRFGLFPTDNHVAEGAELCGAPWGSKDVGEHESAADGDCFDVVDVGPLALSDVAPAKRDVFGSFAEAVFFAEGDGGLAVFVNNSWLVLYEAELLAQLAEEDCFLCGGA